MTEYVHLVGAEEVSRAASTISSAADTMRSAATTIDNTLYEQRQFLDDWLNRLSQVIADSKELLEMKAEDRKAEQQANSQFGVGA